MKIKLISTSQRVRKKQRNDNATPWDQDMSQDLFGGQVSTDNDGDVEMLDAEALTSNTMPSQRQEPSASELRKRQALLELPGELRNRIYDAISPPEVFIQLSHEREGSILALGNPFSATKSIPSKPQGFQTIGAATSPWASTNNTAASKPVEFSYGNIPDLKQALSGPDALATTCRQVQAEYKDQAARLVSTLVISAPVFETKWTPQQREIIASNLSNPWPALNISRTRLMIKIFFGRVRETDEDVLRSSFDIWYGWRAIWNAFEGWMRSGHIRFYFEVVLSDGRVATYEFSNQTAEKARQELATGVCADGSVVDDSSVAQYIVAMILDCKHFFRRNNS